ncbi:MAG: ABC transporter substrate-binding protein [Methylococcales bacterium]
MNDIETLDMETSQAGAAFLANRVDAAVVWEPWLTKAKEEGGGHILASTRDYRDLIVDVLAFNKDVVSQHPQDVQKIVNSVFKAIDFWKRNPVEANKIMAAHFQVSAEKFAAILSGVQFTDLNRNRVYFGSFSQQGPIFQVANKASEIWENAGIIKSAVRPGAIISMVFVMGSVN